MKLAPGIYTTATMNIVEQNERYGKKGNLDRSLGSIMLALAVVMDFIIFPIAWSGAMVDGLIARSNKKGS